MTAANPNTKTGETFGASHFDKVAATYEDERNSSAMTKLARSLISFAPPITSTSIVLDNASGPGIIIGGILSQITSLNPAPELYAADISPGMIDVLRKKNWPVESEVMDAQALTYPDEMFTHGVAEMYRTLKPGGVAVISSIKKVGWVRVFQAAQKTVRPQVELWTSPLKEEWSTEEKLRSVVRAGGFETKNIEVKVLEASQRSDLMGDFFASMKDGVTKMITQDWNEVEQERFGVVLEEQIEKAMAEPQDLEVIAWVAVARK